MTTVTAFDSWGDPREFEVFHDDLDDTTKHFIATKDAEIFSLKTQLQFALTAQDNLKFIKRFKRFGFITGNHTLITNPSWPKLLRRLEIFLNLSGKNSLSANDYLSSDKIISTCVKFKNLKNHISSDLSRQEKTKILEDIFADPLRKQSFLDPLILFEEELRTIDLSNTIYELSESKFKEWRIEQMISR